MIHVSNGLVVRVVGIVGFKCSARLQLAQNFAVESHSSVPLLVNDQSWGYDVKFGM